MAYYKNNLYVHPVNQQLLWDTIQKTQLFVQLGNGQQAVKEQWFKNIIQSFYEQNMQVNDQQMLQRLNKETITYMIQQLKIIYSLQPSSPAIPPNSLHAIPETTNYLGKEQEKMFKQEQFNQAFGERQRQYEDMFAKKPIPEVDFSEKLNDEPISNMEELIERHKKNRDAELNKFSPANTILLGEGSPYQQIPQSQMPQQQIPQQKNVSFIEKIQINPKMPNPNPVSSNKQYEDPAPTLHMMMQILLNLQKDVKELKEKSAHIQSNENIQFVESDEIQPTFEDEMLPKNMGSNVASDSSEEDILEEDAENEQEEIDDR